MSSWCFLDVLRMFAGFSRMFSGCSDGSYWPGGIWWSFQMKVWTFMIQRNLMIPNYSMIPAAAIWWSPGIRWSPAIRWSIRSMDFYYWKVYGDTSITDGLVNLNRFVITTKVKYKCFKAHNRRCELSQVYDFLAKRGVAHLTLQVGGYRFLISPRLSIA